MDKQEVIDYLMYTPYNTNLAVLKSMLGEGDWDELLDYVKKTPHSVNRRVLSSLLSANDGGEDDGDGAIVGEAIVGSAVVMESLNIQSNPGTDSSVSK